MKSTPMLAQPSGNYTAHPTVKCAPISRQPRQLKIRKSDLLDLVKNVTVPVFSF